MADNIVLSGNIECEFIGSFFEVNQTPKTKLPQIAFAGRSNVGKSSLLNRLVGRKKMAKVSQTPGKTRSLNYFLINERCYFVDLPGYGYAKVSKAMRNSWGKLIENYLVECEQLTALVLLLDSRRDFTAQDRQMLGWLGDQGLPVLPVSTKIDKLGSNAAVQKKRQIEAELGVEVIQFSSVTGVGKRELLSAIGFLMSNTNKT